MIFFFNDTAATEIYTLSLHDALPVFGALVGQQLFRVVHELVEEVDRTRQVARLVVPPRERLHEDEVRSEEHTSELQSRQYLVCRLLLEKKNDEPPNDRFATLRRTVYR